jgi:oleandomycin transport system ATP-binding protein
MAGGLDVVRDARRVRRVIRALAGGGVTVLLTTQYLEEADALADHICVIDHGKVIADGTPADLKRVISGRSWSGPPILDRNASWPAVRLCAGLEETVSPSATNTW